MNYLSLFLNLLNMTVENAAPYLLITIGGVFVARAGVFNISMEGCTEFAAFAANKIKCILRRGVYTTQNTI